MGNNNCEPECATPECTDAGDLDCVCPEGCDGHTIGDGNCDEACKDSLDCLFDKDDCGTCAPGCTWDMRGDYNCN